MSIQLQTRVSALEAEVRLLKEKLEGLSKEEPKKDVRMCPKCGEKPGYHFHVVNCKGPK